MGEPFCCELPRLPRWTRVSPGPAAPSAHPVEGAVGGTSPVPRAGGCRGTEPPHRRAVPGGRLPPWLGGCWRARAAEAGWAGGGGPAEDECGLRAGPPSEESPAELRQPRRRLPRRAAAAARSPPGGARRQQLRRRQPRQHRGEQRFVLAGAAPPGTEGRPGEGWVWKWPPKGAISGCGTRVGFASTAGATLNLLQPGRSAARRPHRPVPPPLAPREPRPRLALGGGWRPGAPPGCGVPACCLLHLCCASDALEGGQRSAEGGGCAAHVASRELSVPHRARIGSILASRSQPVPGIPARWCTGSLSWLRARFFTNFTVQPSK